MNGKKLFDFEVGISDALAYTPLSESFGIFWQSNVGIIRPIQRVDLGSYYRLIEGFESKGEFSELQVMNIMFKQKNKKKPIL